MERNYVTVTPRIHVLQADSRFRPLRPRSRERTAIGRVRLSFSLCLANQPTFDFCVCMGHDHGTSGINSHGYGSRSRLGLRSGSASTS